MADVAQLGVLLWFDWQAISDGGHSFYGRYVYERLLPYFAPKQFEFPIGCYYFFDGDFLPQGPVQLPCNGADEARCLDEVRALGAERCYVVALYASHPDVQFAQVDKGLREAAVTGYLGMTTCPDMDFAEFQDLTGKMALPFAFTIRFGASFEKESFAFVSDEELRAMGFQPSDVAT